MLTLTLALSIPFAAGLTAGKHPARAGDQPPAVTTIQTYRGLTAEAWSAKFRSMRHLAYVRGRRSKQLKRTLMARPSVSEAIGLACTAYGVSCSEMNRIISCESGHDPGARNASSASGLMQILFPSTWRTTPFGRFSPFSAYANALAGAYMLAHGRRGEWVC